MKEHTANTCVFEGMLLFAQLNAKEIVMGNKRMFHKPAPERPELKKLFEEAKNRVDAMAPRQLERMKRTQAKSWARQDMD